MLSRASGSIACPFMGSALRKSLSWTLAVCLLLGAASLHWPSLQQPAAGAIVSGQVPKGLTPAASHRIQELVRQAGYSLNWHAPTDEMPAAHYSGANHAQGWELAFGQGGVHVTPRDRDAGWRWALAFSGYGYAGQVQPAAGAPAMQAEGNRMTYHWDGNLTEWYANEGGGLEQGFSLQRRPAGLAGSGPLHIELALQGTLVPRLTGDAIHFLDSQGGAILRYDRLYVTDATERILPAHLEIDTGNSGHAAPATIRIVVDDSAAVYPIAIDPWLQQAKLTASDAAEGDRFGYSVAVSGDTVVVGAPYDVNSELQTGSAYVFVRPAGGWANSTEAARLTASDGADKDQFGYSVAIDGDTIAVGAPASVVDGDDAGSVYLFLRPEEGWATSTESAKLTASDGADGDKFGHSVGVSGQTVLVGVPSDDDNGSGSGSVYLFVEASGGWATATETAKLTASDGAANDKLGHTVAISGDTAVAGAPYDDDNGSNSGSAYLFVRPSGGWATGTETAKLTASDGSNFHGLGESVAIHGDTVAAGAPGTTDHGNHTGSVYVFVRPETGWQTAKETARLTASDGEEGDNLGDSVAISEDAIVAGAPYDDDAKNGAESGSAYLFIRPAGGWATGTETQKLNRTDASAGDEFGGAVSASGGAAVIGTEWDDDGGNSSGSAYVFVNGFCSKTSGDWSSKDAWVGGAPPSDRDDACISSGNTFVVSGEAQVRRLLIAPGATLILPAGASLSVEEIVTNDGTMQQTVDVDKASVDFLEIQNGDGSLTLYRGVTIDTTSSGASLGEVTVTVRELNPGEYCTGSGADSPPYARRCYNLQPTNDGAARVRLWALSDELEGVDQSNLAVYRYIGNSEWEELAGGGGVVKSSSSYVYADGDTTGFSSFLLAEAGNGPTAITLRGLEVRADPLAVAGLLGGLMAAVAGALLLGWRTRRGRP